MSEEIEIVEVGARDGLQNEKSILDFEERVAFIRRLEDCGVRRVVAVSFVIPGLVPQLAGAEEIMAALPARAGCSRIGLVLNERGWDRARVSGCDRSECGGLRHRRRFGVRNQGASRPVAQQVKAMQARSCAAGREEGGPPISSVTISVAFGCPFEGEVPLGRVAEIARVAAELGIVEIALADTIGAADPWAVRARIAAARAEAPDARLRLHFHDTRGAALANAFAGVEAGVRVLDASCGGLGGCPFAPAATGNVATEDLVWMLHRAGFSTGVDVEAMIAAGRWVGERIGKAPVSSLSRAGPFP